MQQQDRYDSVLSTDSSDNEPLSRAHSKRTSVATLATIVLALVAICACAAIGATSAEVDDDSADDALVEKHIELDVRYNDAELESTGIPQPTCRCTSYLKGASLTTNGSLCMTMWGGPNAPCAPTSVDGKCKLGSRKCTVETSAPKPVTALAEEDAPCLCTFDVDRTLTAKLGSSYEHHSGKQFCAGSSSVPGAIDHGFGTGTLTLSEAATVGVNATACGTCYLGIVSYGGAGNNKEKQSLADNVLNSDVYQELAARHPDAKQFTRGIHVPAKSPLVIYAPDRRKQWAVEGILAWYWSKGVKIPRERVWHFDDRADNALYFEGTNFNAHQISCASRDRGMIGFCGATKDEFVLEPGVSACKSAASSNVSKSAGKPTHKLRGARVMADHNAGQIADSLGVGVAFQKPVAAAQARKSRGQRLCESGVHHVYHQTSMEACRSILDRGFRHGVPGIIGSGIYFAESPAATGRKTRHYGCMLEVQVRLGRIYDMGKGYYAHAPQGAQLNAMGYDAVTIEDISRTHFGREYEIFYQDQIVDMFAYPCDGMWVHNKPPSGNRTGDFISGKRKFDDASPPCNPSDFNAKPRLADEPEEFVAAA